MTTKSIKTHLADIVPKGLRVPVRYYFNYLRGTLEAEMAYLSELVGDAQRAIDIGANTGLYTYALSRLCNQVEAFEPLPWVFQETSAYARPNINFYNFGISDHQGDLNLHVPLFNGKPSGALASFRDLYEEHETISVPVRRLDDFKFSDVSLIKIDVEGYETQVIDGAIETIRSSKPNLLIEIEQRHLGDRLIDNVFKQVLDLGYCGKFLIGDDYVDLSHFSYLEHQAPFIEIIELKGHCKKYVNNFIFSPVI
jgi:FkbM family methyltransferase